MKREEGLRGAEDASPKGALPPLPPGKSLPDLVVSRRKDFGLAAKSYEVDIDTLMLPRDIIPAVHDWACQRGIEFGGWLEILSNGHLRLRGEFPPNKFPAGVNFDEHLSSLVGHLGSEFPGTTASGGMTLLTLASDQFQGSIGLKPGYRDALPHPESTARNALVASGVKISEFIPVTVFYNYRDPDASAGFARCEEPAVFVRCDLPKSGDLDEVVRKVAADLGQISIHLCVGSASGGAPTHESWKIAGQMTSREAATAPPTKQRSHSS